MKKLIAIIFTCLFSSVLAAEVNLRDYDEYDIPEGTHIPVISLQEFSTAYCEEGDSVKFVTTSDIYLYNKNIIPEGNNSYKQSYNPHNNTVAHWPGRPVLPASHKPPSMRKPVSEICMEHPDKYRPYISYSIPHQSPAYPDKSPEVSSQIPQNAPYVWLPFPSFPRHQENPPIHQLSEQ